MGEKQRLTDWKVRVNQTDVDELRSQMAWYGAVCDGDKMTERDCQLRMMHAEEDKLTKRMKK